jgi:hypothetical protein
MRFPPDLSAFLEVPAVSPRERHFHHDHHSITSSDAITAQRWFVGFFLSCSIAQACRYRIRRKLHWVHNSGTQTKSADGKSPGKSVVSQRNNKSCHSDQLS